MALEVSSGRSRTTENRGRHPKAYSPQVSRESVMRCAAHSSIVLRRLSVLANAPVLGPQRAGRATDRTTAPRPSCRDSASRRPVLSILLRGLSTRARKSTEAYGGGSTRLHVESPEFIVAALTWIESASGCQPRFVQDPCQRMRGMMSDGVSAGDRIILKNPKLFFLPINTAATDSGILIARSC